MLCGVCVCAFLFVCLTVCVCVVCVFLCCVHVWCGVCVQRIVYLNVGVGVVLCVCPKLKLLHTGERGRPASHTHSVKRAVVLFLTYQ